MLKRLLICLLIYSSQVHAQKFLNGDFENTALPRSMTALSNAAFNNLMSDAHSFGSKGSISVYTTDYYLPPHSGNQFIVIRGKDNDLLSLKLNKPLVKGNDYKISFWDMAILDFLADTIEIGLSTTMDSIGSQIHKTKRKATTCGWRKRSFRFIAPNNGQYITISVQNNRRWSMVALDNFSFECPKPNLGQDFYACTGEEHLLKANVKGADYLWSDSTSSSQLNVTKSGKYWVSVTKFSCTVTDTIEIIFKRTPSFDLGKDTVLCQGEPLNIKPGIQGDYLWSTNSTDSLIAIENSGLYWLDVTRDNCKFRDSIQVTFIGPPRINLDKDVSICEGEEYVFHSPYRPHLSYLWSNGSKDQQIIARSPGLYWLSVSDSVCTIVDSTYLKVVERPRIDLGNDTSICANQSLKLEIEDKYDSVLWSTNSQSNSIEVSIAGIYSVEVSESVCKAYDTIQIKSRPMASIELGNDTSFCRGNSLKFNFSEANVSYYWMNEIRSNRFEAHETGEYYVEAVMGLCSSYDTIQITVKEYPEIDLGPDTLICLNSSYQLDIDRSLLGILWQDGQTSESVEIKGSGKYWVQGNHNGCVSSDTLIVSTYDCVPSLQIPNVFTPNKDGVNDTWHPIYENLINDIDLKIFDRNGNVVYRSNDLEWNGNGINGDIAPNDTYFFVVSYTENNGQSKSQNGNVTLLR